MIGNLAIVGASVMVIEGRRNVYRQLDEPKEWKREKSRKSERRDRVER